MSNDRYRFSFFVRTAHDKRNLSLSFVINMTSVKFYSSKKNVDLLFDESIIESILQSLIFEK